MASFPKINGVVFDFSSVELDIAGEVFTDVEEITYSHTLEPGEMRGTRAELLGRTRGEYSAEGSITFRKAAWGRLVASLGEGYLEQSVDITVNYAEEGEDTISDKLFGARFTAPENSHSQGSDPLNVSVDISIVRVEENGVTPIAGMLR